MEDSRPALTVSDTTCCPDSAAANQRPEYRANAYWASLSEEACLSLVTPSKPDSGTPAGESHREALWTSDGRSAEMTTRQRTLVPLQEEFAEWEKTNRLLRRHGCAPVRALRAPDGGSLSGALLLDADASLAVRNAIKSLVQDSERRQNLIHDLIQANNQLKEDVRLQQSRADRSEQKAGDLRKILENVKSKIRDLEDDFLSKTCKQQTQMKSLLQEKQTVQEQNRKCLEKLREREAEISELRRRVAGATEEERRGRGKGPPTENNVPDLQTELPEGSLDLDASPNYRALLKSFQEQIREGNRRREELEGENWRIRSELERRPTVEELKRYKRQARRLQKALRSLGETEQKPGEPVITAVQHLERLPVGECRRYLQAACSELDVRDLKDFVSVVSSVAGEAEICARLRKALHGALRKLGEKLLPHRQTEEGADGPGVEELLLLVDRMVEEVESGTPDGCHVSPRRLQAQLSHFRRLFDVSSPSGVVPTMNAAHRRLGEADNMMRNLRCLLGMDGNASCSALVTGVGRLCRNLEEREGEKLQRVLGMLDIDSIINKLQEHEEFFPAFDGLIKELLDLLEISRLEEIVPAVRRLRRLPPVTTRE
ncbi:centrosomal protein of 70 kDa [Spea bombifrons]|uniref:centrosomal protein of 70 kDa n=1 Tax=Spea bombifrons TaxID=233779 RepID=UPI00234B12B9|nr:centrosomal protein of 70 kDa [Spea bombifrons]